MSRLTWALLLLAALSAGSASSRAQHPPGHGASPAPSTQKADALDELKGLTLESVQKGGKVQEIAPGTVQISPERQQLIGVCDQMGSMLITPGDAGRNRARDRAHPQGTSRP